MAAKRVALLGGGVGAMTVAWELSRPERRDQYDITVYQMGWRIGGQGASGRNREAGDRIEEHGLHAWGGFYENAFQIMAEVYRELGRKPGQPLARLWDPGNSQAPDVAFRMHHKVVFCEFVDGQWVPWEFPFSRQPGMPGELGDIPTIEEMAGRGLQTLLRQFGVFLPYVDPAMGTLGAALARRILAAMQPPEPQQPDATPNNKRGFLSLLSDLTFSELRHLVRGPLLKELFDFLDKVAAHLQRFVVPLVKGNTALRRDLIVLDFLRVTIAGIYRENIIDRGFDHLEDIEFSDWLKQNGAMQLTLDSVLVRGFYDYMFSFLNGDPSKPRISAGTALWHSLRLTVGYRGAPFFLMQAGMGDTVFAPFYLTLKKRGVKFKFFHRVDQLNADPRTKSISSIELTKQVNLVNEEDGYDPLFDVKGLPCWPSTPFWEQIENGDELKGLVKDQLVMLEAPAIDGAAWKDENKLTLKAGRDFDLVISNLSIAALAEVGKGLYPANPMLEKMVFMVKTVPTMAVQLWFTETLHKLGWTAGTPILTGYQRPNSTWGDLSHLLERENWQGPNGPPKSIAYFCGPLLFPASVPLLKTPAGRLAIPHVVRAMARQWFQDNAWQLFPQATSITNPTALDYNFLYPATLLLADPNIRRGFELGGLDVGLMLFDDQYVRGNVTPAERYVISTPGDRTFRPREGESGIQNLYFVGDWIYTGLGSCVEAAAMAGLMVARRLTGQPEFIPGELPQTRLGCQAPKEASSGA